MHISTNPWLAMQDLLGLAEMFDRHFQLNDAVVAAAVVAVPAAAAVVVLVAVVVELVPVVAVMLYQS